MQVYFAGAIRNGRECTSTYRDLISFISSRAEVLTEHIGSASLSSIGESELSDREIYLRDIQWLKACDAVIAEVSNPSLGVGYELAYAEDLGKPVLCLFQEDTATQLSAMTAGNISFLVKRYDEPGDAQLTIDRFIRKRTGS